MSKSPYIDHAIDLAKSKGNSINDIVDGWSKVEQVIYMSSPLTNDVRQIIENSEPSLRYWNAERTPHNRAEEGFICDEYKVAITFPK
ncbi:hypothetical protein EIC82_20805 [Enterobacter sp. A11]|uniref:hypothetical protein n=1 Tax=unclassified Enterobacter TaxID=2608935 RepID=UPI00106FA862|nr:MULTISPECIES: hypothetical protein [unclassified Enterobacter]MBM1023792.1 hypothetical protein [Enterobacter sp. E1]MEA3565116.1 hypothetical protein [Enterobacter sp. GM-22]MEA3598716.1 hypothetical protein [Enterobacter sp. GM-31]TFF54396.1 hypothetical protein EIC82_20805 [Enterobacter sp. A11]